MESGIRNGVEGKDKVEVEGEGEGEEVRQEDRAGLDQFEFSIFCSNKDLDGSVLQGAAFDEWVTYNTQTRVWYSSKKSILPVLQSEIKKQKPDHLFIVGIYDGEYNLKPLLFCKGVKKIISVRGMLHPGALTQKSFKKNVYLGLWKLLGLHKKNIFHATTVEEKEFIEKRFGKDIDVKIAANLPAAVDFQQPCSKMPGQLKMCTTALISPMKNHLPVLKALRNVNGRQATDDRKEEGFRYASRKNRDGQGESLRQASRNTRYRQGDIPLIEYDIYGPVKDKTYWQQCEALIKQMPENIKVTYRGEINPEQIVAALSETHLVVQPSKSENYGHSLYEALLAGRPLITSQATPWNKLEENKAGKNVNPENTDELVNAIEYFAAMNNEEYIQYCEMARQYAINAVDIEAIKQQYRKLFE